MIPELTNDPERLKRFDWLSEVRSLAVKGSWSDAVAKLNRGLRINEPRQDEAESKKRIRQQFFAFLEDEDYIAAGLLQWRRSIFEPGPWHVQRLIHTLTHYDKVCLVGSANLGKSYDAVAWAALDFMRDPGDTGLKMVSVSHTNLKDNLWGKIRNFLAPDVCLFPLNLKTPNDTRLHWGVRDARQDCSIDGILVGRGTEATGKVKGYHPVGFRPEEHPKYGYQTRIRLFFDECLPYETPVLLADGTSKAIGDIVKSKDAVEVMSYNVATGKQKASKVVGWQEIPNRKPLVKISTRSGVGDNRRRNFVVCTEDHKVWTENRGWVKAGALKIGDVAQIETGVCPAPAIVHSVEPVRIRDRYVYDLTVEGTHCFYANGILVHNCQNIPEGVRGDLNSPLASVNPDTHEMKVVLMMNLINEKEWAIQEATPHGGWTEEQSEALYDWESERGWRVCRVDSRRFENVEQKRTVFRGFLAHTAEAQYKVGSTTTAAWWTFWAGWVPPGRAADVWIPSSWFEQALGEPVYVGQVQNIAGLDPSYDSDRAVLAVGRYGQASGWLGLDGVVHKFDSRGTSGQVEQRHATVLDQLITLESKNPNDMADEVKAWCQKLRIPPENLVVDKTGAGVGVSSNLTQYWGSVVAQNWKAAPTLKKILAEDKDTAEKRATNIISEMCLTVREWIQMNVRAFFINPIVGPEMQTRLKHQMTTRGFKWGTGNRFDIETKDKYKARNNGDSPGEGDATVMMVHVPRVRGFVLPALVDEQVVSRGRNQLKEEDKDHTSETRLSLSVNDGWVKPELVGGDPVKMPRSLESLIPK